MVRRIGLALVLTGVLGLSVALGQGSTENEDVYATTLLRDVQDAWGAQPYRFDLKITHKGPQKPKTERTGVLEGWIEDKKHIQALTLHADETQGASAIFLKSTDGTLAAPLPPSALGLGALSPSDLTLEYLHWHQPEFLGESKSRGRNIYLLSLKAPRAHATPIQRVELEIEATHHYLLKASTYDASGALLSTFQVLSVKRSLPHYATQVEWFFPKTQEKVQIFFKNPAFGLDAAPKFFDRGGR